MKPMNKTEYEAMVENMRNMAPGLETELGGFMTFSQYSEKNVVSIKAGESLINPVGKGE